jgi:hypothetical protein
MFERLPVGFAICQIALRTPRTSRIEVIVLLVISQALGVDPVELFVEIARSAGRSDH